MTRDSEPWHRQWLHAMEADTSVPGDVMQVARIHADYSASSPGGRISTVSYSALQRQTHRRYQVIADAHEYMSTYGWLVLLTQRRGQRGRYELTMGRECPVRPWRPLRTGGEVAPRPTSPGHRRGSPPDGGRATSPPGGRQTSHVSRPSALLPAGEVRHAHPSATPYAELCRCGRPAHGPCDA